MKNVVLIFFSILSFTCHGQLSGRVLLDGIYGMNIQLNKSEDSFMEGSIAYDGEDAEQNLIATTRGDTLRCQEIDAYLNPVSTMFLIKQGDQYKGEWYDEHRKFALPATLFLNNKNKKLQYQACLYDVQWSDQTNQILFEIPLSPTVNLGKYIQSGDQSVRSFSSNTSFNRTEFYSNSGVIILGSKKLKKNEMVDMENYQYFESGFSIEALIPSFSVAFVDSLQSALVRWKERLVSDSIVASKSRFPTRYYAICDLDYWTEDWISGSFEYVGPNGNGQGFTFIFDRKNDRFISFDQLMRSGNWEELLESQPKESLGISFDYYGILYKDRFNAIQHRKNKHIAWAQLDVKLKRKLNEIQN